jgi:hypothetical protein
MADSEQHRAKLQQLNRNFVRSVEEADVAWFDANLAPDFFNANSDGSFIDRKAFLAQIARGSSFKNIREHEVLIRTLGDFATATESPTVPRVQAATPMIGSCAATAGNAFRPNRQGSSLKARWAPERDAGGNHEGDRCDGPICGNGRDDAGGAA